MIQNITSKEAKKIIEENKNIVVLDVRTREEFDNKRIENAVNLDIYSPEFENGLDKIDKEKTYLVYCQSGSRSNSAAKLMESLGFKNVYNLIGGIMKM